MLYFPDEKNGNDISHQKKYGTEFWASKEKNFDNIQNIKFEIISPCSWLRFISKMTTTF